MSPVKSPRLWLASFAIATALGFAMALQVWLSVGAARRPFFWSPEFLQPQLIPWLVWAALTPPLIALARRLPRSPLSYVALGATSIVVHSVASGLVLGWWWAFPSLVPMNPEWHIAYLLKSRTVFGVFIVGLVAVSLRAGRRAPISLPPLPAHSRPSFSRIALRTRDRITFARPEEIDWIEADGDYCIVHTNGTSHRIRARLSRFESRLVAHRLVRVSRSAIVNVDRIAELRVAARGNYLIVLRDGTNIPTGKRYRDRLTHLF
jgi:hypothetical protein